MLKVENLIESSAVQSFSTKGGTATAKEFIETGAVSALGLESVYPHADMTDSVALRTLPGGQVISKLFEEITGLDRVQVVPNIAPLPPRVELKNCLLDSIEEPKEAATTLINAKYNVFNSDSRTIISYSEDLTGRSVYVSGNFKIIQIPESETQSWEFNFISTYFSKGHSDGYGTLTVGYRGLSKNKNFNTEEEVYGISLPLFNGKSEESSFFPLFSSVNTNMSGTFKALYWKYMILDTNLISESFPTFKSLSDKNKENLLHSRLPRLKAQESLVLGEKFVNIFTSWYNDSGLVPVQSPYEWERPESYVGKGYSRLISWYDSRDKPKRNHLVYSAYYISKNETGLLSTNEFAAEKINGVLKQGETGRISSLGRATADKTIEYSDKGNLTWSLYFGDHYQDKNAPAGKVRVEKTLVLDLTATGWDLVFGIWGFSLEQIKAYLDRVPFFDGEYYL